MSASEVEVNEQGRVTIPKELRDRLGIQPGARLVASDEDGRLVLERRDHMLRRLQRRIGALRTAAGHEPGECASDELIADRRAEAARDGDG